MQIRRRELKPHPAPTPVGTGWHTQSCSRFPCNVPLPPAPLDSALQAALPIVCLPGVAFPRAPSQSSALFQTDFCQHCLLPMPSRIALALLLFPALGHTFLEHPQLLMAEQ